MDSCVRKVIETFPENRNRVVMWWSQKSQEGVANSTKKWLGVYWTNISVIKAIRFRQIAAYDPIISGAASVAEE